MVMFQILLFSENRSIWQLEGGKEFSREQMCVPWGLGYPLLVPVATSVSKCLKLISWELSQVQSVATITLGKKESMKRREAELICQHNG